MFCPRCGRPVSDIANFCGGCGLPRADIEKAAVDSQPVNNTTSTTSVYIEEINKEIEKLENDLSGRVSVNDYNTDVPDDTNNITTPSDFIRQEIKEENKTADFGRSRYSYNRPSHYNYTPAQNTVFEQEPAEDVSEEKNQNLSTVDFIWIMLISGLPVVGMMYIIWLAFIQKDNVNKQSYARAVLIFMAFSFALAMVFAMGLIITQVSMFY